MKIRLGTIDELFNYNEIKEYIIFNCNYGNKKTVFKIKLVLSSKPNYQLFTESSGVITMAYEYIPDYINFYILNDKTLIKIITDKEKNNQIFKHPGIDIELVNNEYDCNIDEETADTRYDD